ncbi:MAG: hypothetical protein QMD23_06465 [Candidatus Bathyarchaeia archaeon]|nr:hypothetical protein [Candidatus Bathyarchaeia archaeon]
MKQPTLIDGRRIINPHVAENLGFIYYGLGFGKPAASPTIKK